MRTPIILRTLFGVIVFLLARTSASAHPGSGIVIDKNGHIYFTDTGQGVWKIDNQGKLTYVPASRWHWMAIDEVGNFAGSQKNFGEWFERITPQGSKPTLIMCSDFPLTVNRDGNIYYAHTRRSSPGIVRRRPDGTESVVARGEMFNDISGITAAPDGSLYVTETGRPDSNAIRRIAIDGTVSTIAIGFVAKDSSNDTSPITPAGYCRGLAVDSQGVVYVAGTGSRRVFKISPQGEVSTILRAPSPWSPTGVALFRGEVYVLEWREPAPSHAEDRRDWIPRVRKIGRDGKLTTLATVSR
jgi:sugar lactone lactonase YvrE